MSAHRVGANVPEKDRGRKGTLWVLALTLLVVLGSFGVVLPAGAENLLHARISFDSGGAMVKGTTDADWSYATVNTLILPGDTLWVDKQGTLEVELSGGTFLRMADGSKAEVVTLPPMALVKGRVGAFYIQRINRSTGAMAFETAVCRVNIERDSQVRVDVMSNGGTTVTVRWGGATVWADGGDMTSLSAGQRCYCDPGYLPSEPRPFDRNQEDAFDSWNRERARLLATGCDNIPDEVIVQSEPIGVADLNPYGEWVYVNSEYYWHPTFVVDYVPYRAGHWSFVPACGYVWVGDYPFCYVTSHYGRWHHHDRYGWLWSYRDVWGPAWVATVRYGPNFVWCPLDPWDRPCVTTAEFFTVGGLHFGVSVSSYCPADVMFMGPCFARPCMPGLFYGIPPRDIHIWNIYIGDHRPPHRVPYTDHSVRVRDYSPRRVIRGFEGAEIGKSPPRARVASLEVAEGGPRDLGPTPPRAVRTAAADGDRVRMRPIKLDGAGASEMTATPTRGGMRRPERVTNDTGVGEAGTTPGTQDGFASGEHRIRSVRTRAIDSAGETATDNGQPQGDNANSRGRMRAGAAETGGQDTSNVGNVDVERPTHRVRTSAPNADTTHVSGNDTATDSNSGPSNSIADRPTRVHRIDSSDSNVRTQTGDTSRFRVRDTGDSSFNAPTVREQVRTEPHVSTLAPPVRRDSGSRTEVMRSSPLVSAPSRQVEVRSAPEVSAPSRRMEVQSAPQISAPSRQVEVRSAPQVSAPSRQMSVDSNRGNVGHGGGGSSHRSR